MPYYTVRWFAGPGKVNINSSSFQNQYIFNFFDASSVHLLNMLEVGRNPIYPYVWQRCIWVYQQYNTNTALLLLFYFLLKFRRVQFVFRKRTFTTVVLNISRFFNKIKVFPCEKLICDKKIEFDKWKRKYINKFGDHVIKNIHKKRITWCVSMLNRSELINLKIDFFLLSVCLMENIIAIAVEN